MSRYVIKIVFLSIQNTHYKNLIFRTDHSIFQNSGRPAQGGSRPICTNVHKIELAVDRFTNQSTGLGDLELTWSSLSVRSTGSRPVLDRQCKAQSIGSRPVNSGAHALWPVDRQSTGTLPPSQFPVDRQSTGGRPIG